MKVLAKYIGGSKLYGLDGPNSDVDERGVFINEDVNCILGLDRHDHQIRQNSSEDSQMYEIRHFFNLLKSTNTQCVEMLFAPKESFSILDEDFERLVLDNRQKFLDTEKFFVSISGYLKGEIRRANGDLTGKLGCQRKEAIEKYGYSPKNFVHALRLAYCGKCFFEHGEWVCNIGNVDRPFHHLLTEIKFEPERHNVVELNLLAEKLDGELKEAFDNRDLENDYVFNKCAANRVLLELYYPEIKKSMDAIK